MLRMTLQINNEKALLDVSIRRLTPDNPEDGQPCRYLVEKITDEGLKLEGAVLCPYGDVNELAIRVLEMIDV